MKYYLFLIFCFGVWPGLLQAEEPEVVVTIRPLHSLVASVMEGIGTPTLLMTGAVSPHDFHMKPSHMRLLYAADVIFYIGPVLEGFLQRPLQELPQDIARIAMVQQEGIDLLALGDNAHHAAWDPHIWLDLKNTQVMVAVIARELCVIRPKDCAVFQSNQEKMYVQLEQLQRHIKEQLASVKDVPFLVSHDALRYVSEAYDLMMVGVVHQSHSLLGMKRVRALRQQIQRQQVVCLFYEPYEKEARYLPLQEGSHIVLQELDLLGLYITPGPTLYTLLMERLVRQISHCL